MSETIRHSLFAVMGGSDILGSPFVVSTLIDIPDRITDNTCIGWATTAT